MACITKRRNRWVIDFYDQNGRRRWKTLPAGTTKTKAKEKLRGVFLPTKAIPLFSEVAQDWLEYKKPNLRETTWETYYGHVRNHFPELNDRKISRIATPRIEKYIATRQKKGMHILTLRKILVTLNQIMSYAVRHKYIDYNPVRDAERPRDQRKETKKSSS